jgi:hypothetical protein
MEETIKRMRERIAKLECDEARLEKEIAERMTSWKDDAQRIFDVLCDEDNIDSYFDDFDIIGDAESIQQLKDTLNTLRKETLPESKIIEEWFIAESYVCAVEYGDLSGGDFSEDEIEDIKDFQSTLETFSPYGHLMWGEESEYETDHISGLKANCLKAMMVLV